MTGADRGGPDPAPDDALPVVVLGGYLGAGKTTLVNHLLRHAAGRRIAVMVNDFGDVGIDADLIVARDGDVVNLAGGCVCCSVGSDLVGALCALPARCPRPDLVLIETSGVALPGAVARSIRLAPGVEVDGVVVMADAETVRARAGDRYVGDTVSQQLRDADLLIVNKVDLVDAAALSALHRWLAVEAPRARRLEAVGADVPADVVLGLAGAGAPVSSLARRGPGLFSGDVSARRLAARAPTVRTADRYDTASVELPGPVDALALGAALADPALGLIRAKGMFAAADGSPHALQLVGPRWRVEPASCAVAGPGRLVVIGLRGAFDADAVLASVARACPAAAIGRRR
jgi:G3E family GTPase